MKTAVNRTLPGRRRLDDAAAHEQLAADLFARHLLSRVLIRNRKAVVGGFMPRQAYRWRVELTAPEHTALRAVTAYVEFGYKLAEAVPPNSKRSDS